MFNQIAQWHKDAQYEPIVGLLEILIETSNGPLEELENATQQTKALLYAYFGDSLFRLKYFRRALRAFEQALSFSDSGSRRASKRCKTNNPLNINCDINSSISTKENEIKYQIHLCHLRLHEIKEARTVLERIPSAERDIKILLSLADIYYQEKNCDRAREVYLDILKKDPLRLDVVMKICRLGGCELDTLLDLIPDDVRKTCPWYSTWIAAQCSLHSPDSKKAIRLFESLTSRFERRASILTSLAEAYYHDGNFREAVRIFQIAYISDPLTLTGIGSYAACLHKESSKRTLEELAVSMSLKCSIEGEYFHEPWLALAHYYASNDKKEPKALLFVQKAYKLNRYSIEALILLACLCLEKKDSSKAIPYIVTAQLQAPYRYEVQRILCDAFLANNKRAAALNYAKAAITSLGESARSYYLWADIMLKSQLQRRKNSARSCLEKAIKLDPTYLPAIFAFADLMMEEKKFDRALEVLNSALPHHSINNELHKYLYNCYSEKKDNDRALYHQNLALDHTTSTKSNHESLHRGSQENAVTQEDVDTLLGLEADELVDHGDSEVDDANLDA
jgi:anaphase-promoting complex subunit 7